MGFCHGWLRRRNYVAEAQVCRAEEVTLFMLNFQACRYQITAIELCHSFQPLNIVTKECEFSLLVIVRLKGTS